MTNYAQHLIQLGNNKAFIRRVDYLKYNFSHYLRPLNKNSTVLEIGPGLGELLFILNRQNINQIDIIDNDQAVLKYCQKQYSLRHCLYAKNNNLAPLIKNHRYDLIVLTQVFEHIPKSDYLPWLKSLYSVLNPGGHILITSPNGANPLSGTERYGDIQHVNLFTTYSFDQLMTFANLKNSTYRVTGFVIPPTSLVNLIRIALQKLLHAVFLLAMMVNGAIYQSLLTPNITLIISKKAAND